MRKILLSLISCSVLFSYEVNDKVALEVLEQIGVKNGITVVDFFASWCVSCKKELPLIDKLSREMKDVHFIGVDSDEEKEDGVEFQKSLNLTFDVYNDNTQKVVKNFNPIGVPALYIIKDGIVKNVHYGALDGIDEIIKKDISEIK